MLVHGRYRFDMFDWYPMIVFHVCMYEWIEWCGIVLILRMYGELLEFESGEMTGILDQWKCVPGEMSPMKVECVNIVIGVQ